MMTSTTDLFAAANEPDDAPKPQPAQDQAAGPVESVGLGYRQQWDGPDGAAVLVLDRLRLNRGALTGELTVRFGDRHLLAGGFNVSSLSTRKQWAGALRGVRAGVPWRDLLEAFCIAVLAAERESDPFEEIGHLPRREAKAQLVAPLLDAGEPTIVYGAGGTGKSALGCAVSVAVATGHTTIPGFLRPGRASNVLVLDWETDADEWNEKVAATAAGAGLEPPVVHYRRCSASLVDQLEDVARYVTEHDIGLVIVDSVGIASPSVREGTDVNEGTLRLFRALRTLPTTKLLIDHVTGESAISDRPNTKPYGSIYKVNLARSVFELRRERDTDEGHIALLHTKYNAGLRTPPVGLTVEYDRESVRWGVEAIEAPELVSALPLAQRVYHLLAADGAATPPRIASELGEDQQQVRNKLLRWENRLFRRADEGKWEAVPGA